MLLESLNDCVKLDKSFQLVPPGSLPTPGMPTPAQTATATEAPTAMEPTRARTIQLAALRVQGVTTAQESVLTRQHARATPVITAELRLRRRLAQPAQLENTAREQLLLQ